MNYNLAFVLILFFLVAGVAAAPLNDSVNSTADVTTVGPGPYTITLFIPSTNMIHSDKILDLISTPEGGTLIGTSFGLSMYNGTWSTRHINHDNISQGLMDEFITAIEYDHDGNLWIGYSGGIQIYNGVYYQSLRDQQLFKDPRIHDLQRWDDDMWVATGHSGIHRYRNGVWTWFQPGSKGGPGFFEVKQMALDSASDSLIIGTVDNGSWIVRSSDDPVHFEQIAEKNGIYGSLQQVRRDPLGGVYFFDDLSVVHYSPDSGFVPVLTRRDLSMADIEINDITASSDGKLYLATDRGIYIWKDGATYRHLERFEGIGTSEIVDSIFIDAKNRVWFATEGYVGFYSEQPGSAGPIPIEIVTPKTAVITEQTTVPPTTIRTIIPPPTPADSGSDMGGLAPILDPILRAINAILSKLGMITSQPA